jgi:hypothetical protein
MRLPAPHLVLLLGVAIAAAACSAASSAGPPVDGAPAAGAPAAGAEGAWRSAELTDARTGDAFTVNGLEGKLVAIEPMATWCSNCRIQQREAVSALAAIASDDLVYIGLDVDPSDPAEALAAQAGRRVSPLTATGHVRRRSLGIGPSTRSMPMTTVATSTTATADAGRIAPARAIALGVAGGLVGGILFGALMAMQNMLPMVASLVGSQDAFVGSIIHLAISAGAGLVYGLAVSAVPVLVSSPIAAIASGAVYGVIWWVGGALIAMPLMLGMNDMVLAIGDTQLMSLMGHAVFGVATGLVVYVVARRA